MFPTMMAMVYPSDTLRKPETKCFLLQIALIMVLNHSFRTAFKTGSETTGCSKGRWKLFNLGSKQVKSSLGPSKHLLEGLLGDTVQLSSLEATETRQVI